ncbi:hypothetical protein JRO89_XS12G0048900 [Xanthoceras sorbifolium]|uniref:Uncharacterized protein n=1 Tax=Xanthoceras sorbifolium TaxID=99658 RepID=A0ABQ8HB61_9ROSI|nr:hypothetical protein JRO89_XS12G0048900 [Xanthoceras sorbifolium]
MAEAELSCRDKRWSLNGMTALVTGGTRGIGKIPLSNKKWRVQLLAILWADLESLRRFPRSRHSFASRLLRLSLDKLSALMEDAL